MTAIAGMVLVLAWCEHSEDVAMAQVKGAQAQVAAAFESVRKGDMSHIGALVRHGDAVIPAATPFVTDGDPVIRREAVALLDAIDSVSAASAALPALADTSPDVAERAARLILRVVLRTGADKVAGLDVAPEPPPAQGVPGAARLLLLGFTREGEPMLRAALSERRLVKLTDGDAPVDAALPAAIALSLRGDASARQRVRERIANGPTASMEFLLQVVDMIDAPDLLQALATRTLADKDATASGLPASIEPRRRVADLAVETFIRRLKLPVDIDLHQARTYSEEEIAAVLKAVLAITPQ
jgi:hypothetical protein